MDRVAISFGPINIYWYSIFILLGIIVACFIIYKEAIKKNISEDFLINLTFYILIFGILGARLYYVVFNLSYYLSNPIEIVQIWNGGLAIHGGIIAGLIVTIIYSKMKKMNVLKMLDILVVGLIIAQAIGRWGNFFNQEAYGGIVSLKYLTSLHIPKFIINGMYIDGNYHAPTFFYESLWCIVGFIILLMMRKIKNLKLGQLTGFYLLWYGIIRFRIESMRTDSLMLLNLKMAQIISIIFIISGLILLLRYIKNKNISFYKNV